MLMNFLLLLQGGADEGEDLRNAAFRELREETGVTSAEFIAEARFFYNKIPSFFFFLFKCFIDRVGSFLCLSTKLSFH